MLLAIRRNQAKRIKKVSKFLRFCGFAFSLNASGPKHRRRSQGWAPGRMAIRVLKNEGKELNCLLLPQKKASRENCDKDRIIKLFETQSWWSHQEKAYFHGWLLLTRLSGCSVQNIFVWPLCLQHHGIWPWILRWFGWRLLHESHSLAILSAWASAARCAAGSFSLPPRLPGAVPRPAWRTRWRQWTPQLRARGGAVAGAHSPCRACMQAAEHVRFIRTNMFPLRGG